MLFCVFLSQAFGYQNSHYHLQIPGVKSSQLSCDLLPNSLDFLLATSAHSAMLLLQKQQYFLQFDDKLNRQHFVSRYTALFKNKYFKFPHSFPVCNRIQHKTRYKKKKKKAAAKFTEGVSILTNLDDIGRKNVQVLGTQTIFKPKISAATSKLNFT